MRRIVLAMFILFAAAPLFAQQAVVTKAIDSSTGATTDVGNATDHAIRVTQASGGSVWTFNWTQLLGAAPSATNPMPSRLTDGAAYIDPRSIRLLTSSDVVTVVQPTGSSLHVVVDTAPTTAVTGTFWQVTQPVSGTVTTSPPANATTDVTKFGGTAVTIGQQLAAVSIPVILPSATVTTLTPPPAITGFALEAGHLATIDTSTARIPAQGQALAAASLPVVLTAAQVTTLTPPTTVAVTSAGLTNLDVALSTRTKPADQQHAIIDSGTTVVTQATGSNLHIQCDSGCGGAASFADAGAFTAGTTSINVIGGLFDDTPPTAITTGKAAAPRITANRGLHVNLRSAAGAELPLPAALAANGGLKIEGVASGVAVPVSGTFFQATQPVSGTVAATQSGTWTVQPGNTANTTAWKVDGSAVTQPVSGTVSITANSAVNLAQVAGVTTATGLGVSSTGTQRVSLTQEATYAASTAAKTATASGTAAFLELCGSASTTVRVQRIMVSGTWGTAGTGDIQVRKNSSAGTGGTATTLTNVPYDSSSAAATAVAKYFTVLPTGGGALVGNIMSESAQFPLAAAAMTPQLIYVWRDTDAEAPTLRGTAQCLAVGFGTAPGSVPTLSVSVAWTEK